MRLLEGQTVGIDLGTTYSSLAQLDIDGNPISIQDAKGRVTVPSVVLLAADGHVQVGPSRDSVRTADPSRVVEAIKRQMGKKDFFVSYQNKRLTPEFVSALILKKLKQDADRQIGPIANAVITVPYYFNDARRKATQDAGRIAGLNVLDIINEPTAATLAYAWTKGELGRSELPRGERTVLVYDLGGGTFDVTVVRYTPTRFRVLATDGDVVLGGRDWSDRLAELLNEQFQKRHGMNLRESPAAWTALTQECEDAKRQLSERFQVPVTATCSGKSLTVAVTRMEFEQLTADLLQRTRDTTELVLELSGVQPGDLDEVLLVGGSTRMPAVERMLLEVCGRPPSRELSPQEAVAHGAAIHAAILEARETGGSTRMSRAVLRRLLAINTVDVNSHSLGVMITDPRDRTRQINHIMIPRNTPIPHSVQQRFVTNVDNQQRVEIVMLEGETQDPEACVTIGEFQITKLPPNLPAGSPVELTYRYDASGRIHATARELVGNHAASTRIVRESGLDDNHIGVLERLAREYQVE